MYALRRDLVVACPPGKMRGIDSLSKLVGFDRPG
jgi:hypothetical protein